MIVEGNKFTFGMSEVISALIDYASHRLLIVNDYDRVKLQLLLHRSRREEIKINVSKPDSLITFTLIDFKNTLTGE